MTRRLVLVAATPELLETELGDVAALGAALDAVVPPGWPPGEYDADAARCFRTRLLEGGDAARGWYGWYAIARAGRAEPATLVGSVGTFGPPSADGTVEIGYSVVESARGRGFATEMAHAITARALASPAVRTVVAETVEDNVASQRVLLRCGFRAIGEGRTREHVRWCVEADTLRDAGVPRRAAVLVPFVRDDAGTWRLVVVRRASGGIHGGQLAFPGGSVDAGDANSLATALRESEEEIGLPADAVRVLASLPEVDTRVSHYVITPHLAIVTRRVPWRVDPREIDEVHEPALDALLAPGARAFADDLLPTDWAPLELPFYAVGPHRLWGASERILHPLLKRVRAGEWPELSPAGGTGV